MKKYENLVIARKPHGRSYEFRGKAFEAPWFLWNTETRRKYSSYEEYEEEQKVNTKKQKFKENMAAGKKKAADSKKN